MAVLLVVAYHAGLPVRGGFVGVDVFFVISGFVITSMLLRELRDTGRIDFRRFYARRARRLMPALGALVAVVALASLLLETPIGFQQRTAGTGMAASLFVANAYIFVTTGGYFDGAAETNPLLHTWSLSVEEQFYLAFPLLLLIGWRAGLRRGSPQGRSGALAVIASVLVLSLGLAVYLAYQVGLPFAGNQNRNFGFYGSPSRAWEFAAGALASLVGARVSHEWGVPLRRILALSGLVIVVVSSFVITGSLPFPGLIAVPVVAGTALVIVAGGGTAGEPLSVLSSRPMQWIGDRSYSWYLWHWPGLAWLGYVTPSPSSVAKVGVALASLVPAALSYRYLEQRYRLDRTITGWRAVRLAAACVALPTLLLSSVVLIGRLHLGPMKSFVADGAPHMDASGCQANLPEDAATHGPCSRRVPNPKGQVVLLGDSYAGHISEPAAAAANALGYDFTVASFGGCSSVNVRLRYTEGGHDDVGCEQFLRSWTAFIEAEHPTLVVLSMSSGVMLGNPTVALAAPGAAEVTDPTAKAAVYRDAIRASAQAWGARGTKVLVIGPAGQFADFDLRSCPAYRVYFGQSAWCGRQVERSAALVGPATARAAEEAGVAGLPTADTLDLFPLACPDPVCTTYVDGRFRYRDGAHLSVPFASSLTPQFQSAMADLLGQA